MTVFLWAAVLSGMIADAVSLALLPPRVFQAYEVNALIREVGQMAGVFGHLIALAVVILGWFFLRWWGRLAAASWLCLVPLPAIALGFWFGAASNVALIWRFG